MSLADQLWCDDDLRASAMRHGYSGDAYGPRTHRLIRERRRSALSTRAWGYAAAAAVLVLVIAVWGPR